MSEFSKVAGYKINTQELLAFLYTNNEKSEREIKESIPFTIATKRIKYLGINLPKGTKELYMDNYSSHKYFLSTCYMPGSVQVIRHSTVNKTSPALVELLF